MVPVSASAATNLIDNGGFETDVVLNPCCTTVPPGPLTDWTATPNVNLVNGTFGSNPFQNLAYQGVQYLDLVGEGGTGSISQTFATTIGQTYNLTFAYSHNLFDGTPSASAFYSIVGAVSSFSGTVTHSSGTNSNLNWLIFSQNFVASGTSATLSFVSGLGGDNEGVLFDGIVVSAVPEPSMWAMMLFGFGAIGFALRRRKSLTLASA